MVTIEGRNYTAGVLGYTRRCVNAKNITIVAGHNSTLKGDITVGGVISDIQTNGGLKVNYSNFANIGYLSIFGTKNVGGISGIISGQTLDGAEVNMTGIYCNDVRRGLVSGALGETSIIKNIELGHNGGADNIVGATYDDGREVVQNGDVFSKAE